MRRASIRNGQRNGARRAGIARSPLRCGTPVAALFVSAICWISGFTAAGASPATPTAGATPANAVSDASRADALSDATRPADALPAGDSPEAQDTRPSSQSLDAWHDPVPLSDPILDLYRSALLMGFGKDRVTTLEPISWSELETILLEAGAALHDVPDADGLLWMPPDRNDGSGGVPHGREEDWRSAPSTERRSLGEGFVLAGPVDLSLLGAHLFTGESGPKRFQAGDTYEEGLHARLRGGVAWQPHPIVCAAVEARMAAGRTATRLQWTRALAAVRFAGLRLSVGRDSRWWGPGRLEELLLTNNARPGDAIELATDGSRSLGFLGAYRGGFFLSYLDDPTHPTSYPLLFGQRLGWRPAAWVELGVARTIMLGGAGRTERLKLDNVWDIFLGRRENLVGVTGFADTDQKVEFDAVVYVTPLLTWVPGMKGARLFYEYAGDDSFEGLLPTRVAHLAGGSFLFPRMRLDIETFENVAAGPWYWNDEFPQGYTYRGRFIGSELGWDARSWRARSAFAISPDWGVRAEAIWDGKGYEFHQGDRLRPVREGGRYSDAFEASLSVAHRMRPGMRLVAEYRFRNPRHGFTFEHDRRYPRHVFGVALRVG